MLVLFAIIIMVLALVVVFGLGNIISSSLGSIAFSEKVLQQNVENQEKELKLLYEKYRDNDGGFDAYETSILLAKAIEFTWRDCYQICKNERELFTGFFAQNPIDFNRDMSCNQYQNKEPDINEISGICENSKLSKVDEWTVTAWGLNPYTQMCGNYKLSGEDNKQWGNENCEGDNEVARNNKCFAFCDRDGGFVDKIDWQAGVMKKGKKYDSIRIIYIPEGLTKTKIIVKGIA